MDLDQSAMSKANATHTRCTDMMLVAHLCLLGGLGFVAVGTLGRYLDLEVAVFAVVLAQGTLVCVAGGLYPFRPVGRVLWLTAAPIFVILSLLMGMDLHARWTVAHLRPWVVGLAFIVLIGWYIPFGFWLVLGLKGWKLKQYDRSGKAIKNMRVLNLRDMLAITGIAAILLVLTKRVLTKELIETSLGLLVRASSSWPRLVAHSLVGTGAAWLVLRSSRRWAILVSIAWASLTSSLHAALVYFVYTFPTRVPDASDATQTVFWSNAIICAYVTISLILLRAAGWRMERSSDRGKPDERQAAGDCEAKLNAQSPTAYR